MMSSMDGLGADGDDEEHRRSIRAGRGNLARKRRKETPFFFGVLAPRPSIAEHRPGCLKNQAQLPLLDGLPARLRVSVGFDAKPKWRPVVGCWE